MQNLVLILLAALLNGYKGVDGNHYRRVCYYTNWAPDRTGIGIYTVDNIDPSLCTHLIYAFSNFEGNELKNDLDDDPEAYQKFNALKTQQPGLKTLTAVGGWTAASGEFTKMVKTRENREAFITSTLEFLNLHGFDGIDINWKWPTKRGGKREDKENFVLLLQEMREAFGDQYLLTAAMSAGKSTIDNGLDVVGISQYLDFINLHSLDLHGNWEGVTGHSSPLYVRSADTVGIQQQLSVKWAADYWVSLGAPKEKLVIALATYGQSFTLSDASNAAIGAPISGPGEMGTYTNRAGSLSYYEVTLMIESGQGTVHWESEQMVPYYINDKLWVGYENQTNIAIKARWIMSDGYGGASIYSIDMDDFDQVCTTSAVKNPLLTTIRDILRPYQGNGGENGASSTRSGCYNLLVKISFVLCQCLVLLKVL